MCVCVEACIAIIVCWYKKQVHFKNRPEQPEAHDLSFTHGRREYISEYMVCQRLRIYNKLHHKSCLDL